ncbi:MAG: response regulator [Candidatus Omnitrophica bacterium]|nr:response regulator [Candidatus Omnitrophota bacterium]
MPKKRTILVVDDEKDFVKVLKGRLEKKGYKVIVAYNGKEGLEILKDNSPDLIVLDINMPVMGGIEFYNHICDEKAISMYPVLVLTARGELKDIFKEMNADGFIAKPFNIEKLYKEINVIMRKRYGSDSRRLRSNIPKEVLIVDDNNEVFNKIAVAFLNAGYIVHASNNGMSTIEKINEHIPDLLVIRLELSDMRGDVIVSKLRKMPKTADLPVVLYSPEMAGGNPVIEGIICAKTRVEKIVETDKPQELLRAAADTLGIT